MFSTRWWWWLFVVELAAEAAQEEESCVHPSSRVVLSNGVKLDRVGLGTAGRMKKETISLALSLGVRLIDTARAKEWYDEDSAAAGIAGHERSEVTVVTKLHPRDHGYSSCASAIEDSASKFGGYVDVFLQHYSTCWEDLCGFSGGNWQASWRAMEDAYEKGLVRAIGVSNFRRDELQELVYRVARIKPHVVQNWMDPFHQETDTRDFCRKHNISFMAYSTLGTQWRTPKNPVASSDVLREIAQRTNTTSFDVVLKWAIQRGAVVIPRSTSEKHIKANTFLNKDFSCLSNEDLSRIDGLAEIATSSTKTDVIVAVFHTNVDADLFWVPPGDGNSVKVADLMPGRPQSLDTFRGHVFQAAKKDGRVLGTFVVADDAQQHFHVEREEEEL